VTYGIDGERAVPERRLPLRGYRGAGPVRVGNEASDQLHLDAYGLIVEQGWRWSELGHPPEDAHWNFLHELVDAAAERWREPDRGIWEWRGEPRHFVSSKVMCWVALRRGLDLAERCGRRVPARRWRTACAEVRAAVLDEGFDPERRTFRQAFGGKELDAALLRLPAYGFLPYDDPRMIGTVDAIVASLDDHGLLRRHDADDGLSGREGAFLACTFWLAECLSGQGRHDEARAAYRRARSTANDLGLFAEEVDGARGLLLGNFPQALSHLAHVEAALSLRPADASPAGDTA
jgi:GH15 family glucan-1,4-alpha-glucosidase